MRTRPIFASFALGVQGIRSDEASPKYTYFSGRGKHQAWHLQGCGSDFGRAPRITQIACEGMESSEARRNSRDIIQSTSESALNFCSFVDREFQFVSFLGFFQQLGGVWMIFEGRPTS